MTLQEAKAKIGVDELFGLAATSEQRLLVLPLVSKYPAKTGSDYVVVKPPYVKGWQIMFAYPDSKHIPTYLQDNQVYEFSAAPPWSAYKNSNDWRIMTEQQLVQFNKELARCNYKKL